MTERDIDKTWEQEEQCNALFMKRFLRQMSLKLPLGRVLLSKNFIRVRECRGKSL